MILYDLCCGAGGVARCALDMGFRVIGIDHKPQPEYPGEFILADALNPPLKPGADLVWASPPCQGYGTMVRLKPESAQPKIVNEIREVAKYLGNEYVIENVNTCHDLLDPIRLAGSMFGLPLRRWRKFECSFIIPQPRYFGPAHQFYQVVGHCKGTLQEWQQAMFLPGMSRKALTQAVAYPYTRYILTWFFASSGFSPTPSFLRKEEKGVE